MKYLSYYINYLYFDDHDDHHSNYAFRYLFTQKKERGIAHNPSLIAHH